jgi:hypothetical protein
MVPTLFENTGVETLQDIKIKLADSEWLKKLDACGVQHGVFLEKLGKVEFAKSDTRMVPVNYEIAESPLSHTADLDALRQRVEETFDWYNCKQDLPSFVEPYFPFVQSSGMGKTKLLYDLSRVMNNGNDTTCYLCLSGAIDVDRHDWKPKNEAEIFYPKLDFRTVTTVEGNGNLTKITQKAAESVMRRLDELFLSCSQKRLVLLFDEAQVLLTKLFVASTKVSEV